MVREFVGPPFVGPLDDGEDEQACSVARGGFSCLSQDPEAFLRSGMNRALIELFDAGADIPARAIAGLSQAELNAFPVPGTWSIQQIIVHLWESDLAASHRMRRIIAEETPLLIAYDETACAKALFYEQEDIARVCRLFDDNRRMTADLLRRLPDAAFSRVGIHNQRGKVSLADMVQIYVDHIRGHMVHLLRKREMLGKPITIKVP